VDSDLLVPDFATMTAARRRQLSVVLLEGKVVSNKVCQIWDDKTKLGQELKLALDSILMLLPEDDVWVVGIFVRGTFLLVMLNVFESSYLFDVIHAVFICLHFVLTVRTTG
jgi:hypothetical protein